MDDMRQSKAWTALKLKIPHAKLLKEFKKVKGKEIRYRHIYELGKNHALALVSATGQQDHFLPFSKGKTYAPTPLLKKLPETKKLLQRLPGPLFSVRYLISAGTSGL